MSLQIKACAERWVGVVKSRHYEVRSMHLISNQLGVKKCMVPLLLLAIIGKLVATIHLRAVFDQHSWQTKIEYMMPDAFINRYTHIHD